MESTESRRLELREKLIEVLEEGPATTLMESLPPVSWHELATKSDVGVLKSDVVPLKSDVAVIKSDVGVLKSDVGVIKSDVAVLEAKTDAVRVELGAKIEAGLAKLRGEMHILRGDMKLGIARQTYVILAALAAVMTPIYFALFTGTAG